MDDEKMKEKILEEIEGCSSDDFDSILEDITTRTDLIEDNWDKMSFEHKKSILDTLGIEDFFEEDK